MRHLGVVLAIMACIATMHCKVALASRSLQKDNSCELFTSDKSAVTLSADTSRTTVEKGATIKYLLDNQMCNDMLVCVGDAGLSGGTGCSIRGAKTKVGSVCQMKATRTGSTYELSLRDGPACTGTDLVNCLSITADGSRLLVKQECADSISVTLSCMSCGGLESVAVAQTTTPSCGSYGWCGKCDCPPTPPNNCWADCKATPTGSCKATPVDTVTCKPQGTCGCVPADTTKCDVGTCGQATCDACKKYTCTGGNCPDIKSEVFVTLVVSKRVPPADWVEIYRGSSPFTYPGQPTSCTLAEDGTLPPQKVDCTGKCTCIKSGKCTSDPTGSCDCVRTGKCSARPSGSCGATCDVIPCPTYGGTRFDPCDGSKCTKY